jgi:hypothetical protein
MKVVKILAILFVVYVGIVALFESLLGYFQPAGGNAIVITTTDTKGNANERVVSQLEYDGRIYVAANHWPRAWYNRVLENPDVLLTIDGEKRAFRAVSVVGEEFDRVDAANPLGPVIRILTGFPPRRLVRLDPVEDESPGADESPG